ncbi:APC family permease [Actinoplanes sp. NPDC049265]|uniref:APC family permease n=1 Tax=Actinoplanes sp. NPDC049265 TaxID=3363902 RepID=UPI0037189F62
MGRGGVAAALARSRLGVAPLVFSVMAAAAPLTVVAGGATAGFAVTGSTGIPLAYVVVAVVLGLFAVGYVAMSRRIVNAGAFYTYISRGLGKPAGVGGALMALAAYGPLMQVGLYCGFGVVAADFMTAHAGLTMPWWIWAYAAWAIAAVLGVTRIDLLGVVLSVLLVAEICVAVVLAVVQVRHPAGGRLSVMTLSPSNLLTTGLGAALATAIAGFVGFEGTAVFSEETKDPRRTVARATFIAVTLIGGLYAFCAWAMSVAAGPDQIVARSTAEGSALIFNLAAPHLPPAVITTGQFLLLSSIFAAILAFQNTDARIVFALAREGVFPTLWGRVGKRSKAPVGGSITQTVVAFAGIVAFVLTGWDPFTKGFFWLTVLGGVGVLALMTITSSAVVAFFARRDNQAGVWEGRVAPALAFVALAGVCYATVDNAAALFGVDPASGTQWWLLGAYPAVFAVGVVWAFIVRRARPEVYARIGLGAHRTVSPAGDAAALRTPTTGVVR